MLIVLAILALVLGGRGLQIAGVVVLVLVAVALLADRVPHGFGRDRAATAGRAVEIFPEEVPHSDSDADAEYIEKAAQPSEEAWAHEKELYREKEEREGQ